MVTGTQWAPRRKAAADGRQLDNRRCRLRHVFRAARCTGFIGTVQDGDRADGCEHAEAATAAARELSLED